MGLGAGIPFTTKAVKITSIKKDLTAAWYIIKLIDLDGKEYSHLIGMTEQGEFNRALNGQEVVGAHILITFGVNGAINKLSKVA